MQLPVHRSGEKDVVMHHCLAVLESSPEFVERHGVLIAHSLSYAGDQENIGAGSESLASTHSGPSV